MLGDRLLARKRWEVGRFGAAAADSNNYGTVAGLGHCRGGWAAVRLLWNLVFVSGTGLL